MFEIYNRHTPMFVSSEIKAITQIITQTLEFDELPLQQLGVEMIPIFQTVRINEIHPFLLRSKLNIDKVKQLVRDDKILKKLRSSSSDVSMLLAGLVKKMVDQLGVDSYFCIGEENSLGGIEQSLNRSGKYSKKPLIIFNSSRELQYHFDQSNWYDLDHPAIWLENSLGSNMSTTEAFFAVSPTLKMEVGLNRAQSLESFASFAVGMVRF